MTNRTYTFLTAVIGVICGFVIIRSVLFADSLTVRNDLVQGFFVGAGLGVVAVEILARTKATRINGWITIFGCGLPGNDLFTRAACARIFPGPVNVPQEAMYWKTGVDGVGHTLFGERDHILHFPPGGLPPNDAFRSLTMADEKERFVANAINRYSVGDRSGLAQNPDGCEGRFSDGLFSPIAARDAVNGEGVFRRSFVRRAFYAGGSWTTSSYELPRAATNHRKTRGRNELPRAGSCDPVT
jgi:hypothetical protein